MKIARPLIAAAIAAAPLPAVAAAPLPAVAGCTPSPPPAAWRGEGAAAPVPAPGDPRAVNPLTLVLFRHAEKPMRADGIMAENGNLGRTAMERLAHLPDRLLEAFGCPDLLAAPNPAVKMRNKVTGDYFNYIRPLSTIAPLSQKIEFPVWTPYGYDQGDLLARDLLGDKALAPAEDGKAKKVFIAWERKNLRKLLDGLLAAGRLASLAGSTLDVDGLKHICEAPAKWEQCDFDSIWLIHIRDGGLCLTTRREDLNDRAFQKNCKGAESTTDMPESGPGAAAQPK